MISPHQAWLQWRFRRSTLVRNRAELEAALALTPKRIVVEGTEALRAYAATLAYRGGVEAACMQAALDAHQAPPTIAVPRLGRFTDGLRTRRPTWHRRGLPAGAASILVALGGLIAAFIVEYASFPSDDKLLVRGAAEAPLPLRAPEMAADTLHHLPRVAGMIVLVILALAALGYVGSVALGIGRPVAITWRVEHRVQGRLVIARVRTPVA